MRVSRATAECTAYRSAVPSGAPVPTASAPRTRRPVPSDCSSTRSSSVSPTTALAGAGRSRSRSTSAVSRAARRAAQSGAAATTAPDASYSAAQPSTCAASAGEQPGGALGERGPRQLPLRLETGRHRPVLVGRDRRRDGLADGEEGGAARHLEQRQALLLAPRRRAPPGCRRSTTPTAKPSPTTPAPTSRAHSGASPRGSSASSFIAVISSSSPPSMYGTGSASSLTCAQRTGVSSRSSPARTVSLSAECWTSEASVGGMGTVGPSSEEVRRQTCG